MVSTSERISHVARRLGFGVEPSLLATALDTDDAITRALDLDTAPAEPPRLEAPSDMDMARDQGDVAFRFWLEQLVGGPRRIEERLTWFFTDHFATDIRKVRVPYLMLQQHLTIRSHATGSFADLLAAIAIDPAMLIYLDGVQNAVGHINENFGREVLELHTVGRGSFTENDVIEASRAFSGWVVLDPQRRAMDMLGGTAWTARFVPFRHDSGTKRLLGTTANLDANGAIQILLEHPATAETIATKLWSELVGTQLAPATLIRLAAAFRSDYQVMDLVNAILDGPDFLADEAVRSKIRNPLEHAVGFIQAVGPTGNTGRALGSFLRAAGFIPFQPPNPAGYPKGTRLLGPYALVHTFDLAGALGDRRPDELGADELMNSLGIFDVSAETRDVLATAPNATTRTALAINSPEYHLT